VAEAGRVPAAGGHFVLVDLYAIGLRMFCALARRRDCHVRYPYRAGLGFRGIEEDLTVSDQIPPPEGADDHGDSEPEVADNAEFAKMRAVMRAQEKHREGGVDAELEDADEDSGAGT
jgi:hypothetical protein